MMLSLRMLITGFFGSKFLVTILVPPLLERVVSRVMVVVEVASVAFLASFI